MNNFQTSFSKGQEAAVKADLSRKEIESVFIELNKQLLGITDGRVEIFIKKLEKRASTLSLFAGNVFDREKYLAIVARNPKAADITPIELAVWEQSRSGYPCTVSWAEIDHTCRDRESLELCLSSLLEDAFVGEKLHLLMNLPSKEQSDASTQPTKKS